MATFRVEIDINQYRIRQLDRRKERILKEIDNDEKEFFSLNFDNITFEFEKQISSFFLFCENSAKRKCSYSYGKPNKEKINYGLNCTLREFSPSCLERIHQVEFLIFKKLFILDYEDGKSNLGNLFQSLKYFVQKNRILNSRLFSYLTFSKEKKNFESLKKEFVSLKEFDNSVVWNFLHNFVVFFQLFNEKKKRKRIMEGKKLFLENYQKNKEFLKKQIFILEEKLSNFLKYYKSPKILHNEEKCEKCEFLILCDDEICHIVSFFEDKITFLSFLRVCKTIFKVFYNDSKKDFYFCTKNILFEITGSTCHKIRKTFLTQNFVFSLKMKNFFFDLDFSLLFPLVRHVSFEKFTNEYYPIQFFDQNKRIQSISFNESNFLHSKENYFFENLTELYLVEVAFDLERIKFNIKNLRTLHYKEDANYRFDEKIFSRVFKGSKIQNFSLIFRRVCVLSGEVFFILDVKNLRFLSLRNVNFDDAFQKIVEANKKFFIDDFVEIKTLKFEKWGIIHDNKDFITLSFLISKKIDNLSLELFSSFEMIQALEHLKKKNIEFKIFEIYLIEKLVQSIKLPKTSNLRVRFFYENIELMPCLFESLNLNSFNKVKAEIQTNFKSAFKLDFFKSYTRYFETVTVFHFKLTSFYSSHKREEVVNFENGVGEIFELFPNLVSLSLKFSYMNNSKGCFFFYLPPALKSLDVQEMDNLISLSNFPENLDFFTIKETNFKRIPNSQLYKEQFKSTKFILVP